MLKNIVVIFVFLIFASKSFGMKMSTYVQKNIDLFQVEKISGNVITDQLSDSDKKMVITELYEQAIANSDIKDPPSLKSILKGIDKFIFVESEIGGEIYFILPSRFYLNGGVGIQPTKTMFGAEIAFDAHMAFSNYNADGYDQSGNFFGTSHSLFVRQYIWKYFFAQLGIRNIHRDSLGTNNNLFSDNQLNFVSAKVGASVNRINGTLSIEWDRTGEKTFMFGVGYKFLSTKKPDYKIRF
jgi:hypothetical protein